MQSMYSTVFIKNNINPNYEGKKQINSELHKVISKAIAIFIMQVKPTTKNSQIQICPFFNARLFCMKASHPSLNPKLSKSLLLIRYWFSQINVT